MSARIFFIAILFLAGCKHSSQLELLQQNEIQLVKPRLMSSNKIIDSTVTLTADLKLDQVKIFFTDNGEEPTEEAILYREPILIVSPSTYKFKAFHPSWKASETEEIKFINKGYDVDSIIWLQPLSDQYGGRGAKTLVNHKKATNNYLDNEWLGFDKPVGLICKFEKKIKLSSIDIGYLSHPGAWIFPPEEISIYVSQDGIDFKKMSDEVVPVVQGFIDASLATYRIELNEEVLAMRFNFQNVQKLPEWHDGAGNGAWMFMDEIIFNK